MYSSILSSVLDLTPSFWAHWEKDLQYPLSDAERNRIHYIKKASRSVKFQESVYKILTRWYRTWIRTPWILKKMFPDELGCSWRCGSLEGYLFNIFWQCDLITVLKSDPYTTP